MTFFLQVLAVACLVTGLGLLLGVVVESRHALLLWRARRVFARDLGRGTSPGIVEIHGRARSRSPLTAPLSGAACLQFMVVLERAPPNNGRGDADPDVVTFVGASPFVVDDGTGKIDVDLHARRVPVTGVRVERRPLERLTAPLEKLLAVRLGKPGGLWCHGRTVTATEALLVDGVELSVIGRSGNDGKLTPLHVTTGRLRVVALQGFVRATTGAGVAIVLLNIANWLR